MRTENTAQRGYGASAAGSEDAACFSAEDYHQQYLYKAPGGYCPNHSTGVSCPVGLIKAD